MTRATRRNQPTRGKRSTGVRSGDSVLGVLGGFALTYFVLAPHGFEHPWHWVASGAGGLVGGTGVWLYAERERLHARIQRIMQARRSQASPQPTRGKRRA